MAVFAYRSKARSLTVAWGAGRSGKARTHATAATVADMPMSTTERARVAAQAANAKPDPERSDKRRKAAAAAHAPATLAGRIVKAWPELDDEQRAEVLAILRGGGIIQ